MAQMTPWIRPYSLRELLDSSFDLFRARFTTLVLAALIPYLLVVAYVVVMRLYVFPGNLLPFSQGDEQSPSDIFESLFTPARLLFFLGLWGVSMVVTSIANLLQCRIAGRYALGESSTLGAAWARLGKPFWNLVLLYLLAVITSLFWSMIVGIFVFIIALVVVLLVQLALLVGSLFSETAGAVAAGVVGTLSAYLLLAASFFFCWTPLLGLPAALALDGSGPFSALGRSIKLAGSNFLAHFLAFFLIGQTIIVFTALVLAVAWLLRYGIDFISPSVSVVLETVGIALGYGMFLALVSCFQALVYIDGRCRTDYLELRLMAEEVGLGRELEAALAPASPVVPRMGYPNYSTPVSGLAAPTVMPGGGYPDYSSPPPPLPEESMSGGDDAH